MMTDDDLMDLWSDAESDLVERKESASDSIRVKIAEAICAFANDLPDHRRAGVIIVGAKDDGSCAGLPITDALLRTLADMKSNGNIHPFPSMSVEKKTIGGCEIAVIIVQPSDSPPVRYKGRTRIRVGPRRDIATSEEERRLTEKRSSRTPVYELTVISEAQLDNLDTELFRRTYLPASIPADILERNSRTLEQQLASLRFSTLEGIPTVLGALVLGKDPRWFIPCAYIQFLRINGDKLTDPIKNQKELDGPLPDLLRLLDEILEVHIETTSDAVSAPREIRIANYPLSALQQIARNAVLHRNYEGTNAPVRIYWFDDRIEIQNPGGPYGQVSQSNFGIPGIADYRNRHLAEVMKTLGYIQRFGMGISLAREALKQNGNPPPEFTVEPEYILATIRVHP